MEKDQVKIPQDISSYTEDKRKEVARNMIATTKLSNDTIARSTQLKPRQVAAMRLHAQGKLQPPPVAERREQEPEEQHEGEPSREAEELHDIDAPAKPRSPSRTEKEVVNLESQIADLNSKLVAMERSLSHLSGQELVAVPTQVVTVPNGHASPGATLAIETGRTVVETSSDAVRLPHELWAIYNFTRADGVTVPIEEWLMTIVTEYFERQKGITFGMFRSRGAGTYMGR